jgi:regulator of cell morphogenesis and NO signaling
MHYRHGTTISSGMKMSDLILSNHYYLIMLEHFGISLVVQEKTIEDICTENQISIDVFLAFANLYNGTVFHSKRPYGYHDIVTIVSYLQNSHRYYLDEKCPAIRGFIDELRTLNAQPAIELLEKFFREYLQELQEHLDYEDSTVFPYIRDLFLSAEAGSAGAITNNYSVETYKDHHHDIEEKLIDLKNLLIKYLPLKDDNQIRRKLLFTLYEFEYDLHIHSHIEDSILIPLVESLEKQRGVAD